MKRRLLLAGAASVPFAAHAQAKPRIGWLSGRSAATDAHLLEAFKEGLKGTGLVDGQHVTIDVRWADGKYGEVAKMMADLVATKPDIIVAVGGNPVGLAAKAATSTIPVVFGAGADPVAIGLVKSVSRPDANLTGMTLFANLLDAKRLEFLRDIVPHAHKIALLINPTNPGSEEMLLLSQQTAATLGQTLVVYRASSTSEIEGVFRALASDPVDALAVGADAFLINSRGRILRHAAERALPAIYPGREYVVDGGLASYGARWPDMYKVVGNYAGRILKGAKPADLPVQFPTTYEFVVNQQTALALGLALPPIILSRADELVD